MKGPGFKGVIAPLLTPFNDDLTIAHDLFVAHAHRLLANGCVALAPFGTTGEALSVSPEERIAAVQALGTSGIDPSRLIPGTGLSNLPGTALLSTQMLELGCSAVMTLPPHYFKGVTDEGLYAYFQRLLEKLVPCNPSVFLYHIPQVAGVGISTPLTNRLKSDFPDMIVGIKDSSGDPNNLRSLFDIPDLVVYPGTELLLPEAIAAGGSGCISATANLNCEAISKAFEGLYSGEQGADGPAFAEVRRVRMLFQDYAPIPSQKRLLAIVTGERRWATVRPPLVPTGEETGRELLDRLGEQFRCALTRLTSP